VSGNWTVGEDAEFRLGVRNTDFRLFEMCPIWYSTRFPDSVKTCMSKPRWQELCAQASVEQDPQKLLRLVTEINQLLDAKDTQKFANTRPTSDNAFQENGGFQRPE
jgi:hypothetical protein